MNDFGLDEQIVMCKEELREQTERTDDEGHSV